MAMRRNCIDYSPAPAIATLDVWEILQACHSRAQMVPSICFLIRAVHADVEMLEAY